MRIIQTKERIEMEKRDKEEEETVSRDKCNYYKDPQAGDDIFEDIYNKYDTDEERETVHEKRSKKIKEDFGDLCLGEEDLYINFNLDKPGIIIVGKDTYKLIKD